jgi:hypothetical protein
VVTLKSRRDSLVLILRIIEQLKEQARADDGFFSAGLPPDSLTVDQDRIYWTNDAQQVMMSVDKRTGLDLITDRTQSPVKNILAFGDNLQPLPGQCSVIQSLRCQRRLCPKANCGLSDEINLGFIWPNVCHW